MQFNFSLAALLALAVGATAQTTVPADVANSVLMVLATALPTDSISYALASPTAFANEMASSLAAGNTPAWYQALPSDVKSLLPVVYALEVTTTPSATPSITSIIDSSVTPSATANSTAISLRPSASASPSVASGPASTGAAAAYPTAAVGAGVGAALGFLGMLAL
ncbi:hypothetical protein IQ07DRAFT_436496 [Pyrenochaeta sp. DS3sAY3a]|nr:hypothetical protein IQ07DRAFT_436496 [Pyrenochaeta sp. DS3sAY3a]